MRRQADRGIRNVLQLQELKARSGASAAERGADAAQQRGANACGPGSDINAWGRGTMQMMARRGGESGAWVIERMRPVSLECVDRMVWCVGDRKDAAREPGMCGSNGVVRG